MVLHFICLFFKQKVLCINQVMQFLFYVQLISHNNCLWVNLFLSQKAGYLVKLYSAIYIPIVFDFKILFDRLKDPEINISSTCWFTLQIAQLLVLGEWTQNSLQISHDILRNQLPVFSRQHQWAAGVRRCRYSAK